MEANVLHFEPSEALFVPDSTPLLFYERIAHLSLGLLGEGASLFEVNRNKGEEVRAMLYERGYAMWSYEATWPATRGWSGDKTMKMMEQREMETMVKQAYKRMTRLCSRGEYCVFDIRQKLRGWNFRRRGRGGCPKA